MGLEQIASIIETYGIKGGIFTLLIFLIFTLFKNKWFGEAIYKLADSSINKIKPSSIVRNIIESDVTNHDIFNYIDFWIYSRIPTFEFSTEFRTIVFRKYLTIYLKSHKTNLAEFVSSKRYQDMDDSKLATNLLNLINTIIRDYEREAKNAGIPEVVIEKIKVKNNDTINLTIDLIDGICSSQFYSSDDNLLKVYSILNIILSILENTITNSQGVCKSINGQMKGFRFKDGDRYVTEP